MRQHKTSTEQRLQLIGITNIENQLQDNRYTFEPYFYNLLECEVYNASNKDKINYSFYPKKVDNILISYSDIWGKILIDKFKDDAWSYKVQRLRISEPNRYTFIDEQGKEKKSAKYRSAKDSGNKIFVNGLYQFFVRPLVLEGLTKEQIIKKLKPIFSKIVITEGEFKAFTACKTGIPCIATSGIHNAVKTIKSGPVDYLTGYQKTIGATFLKDLQDFLLMFDCKEVEFLHDSDCFDNFDNVNRALSFFASVRNFNYAVKSFNKDQEKDLKLNYCFIDTIGEKFGLDDLILKYPNEVGKIKQDLFAPQYKYKSNYIRKIEIRTADNLQDLQADFLFSQWERPIFYNHIIVSTRATRKWKTRLTYITKKRNISLIDKRIIAATSLGKTYGVMQMEGKKTLLAPTTMLVQNIANDYDAAMYYGKEKEYNKMPFADAIVTTYNSAATLPETIHLSSTTTASIARSERLLIIDELHNFASSTNNGYRLQPMKDVLKVVPNHKGVIGLTGTDFYNRIDELNKLDKLEIKAYKQQKKLFYTIAEDVLKATAKAYKLAIKAGRIPIILFNNKNEADRLGTLLFLLSDYNNLCLNADRKEDDFFKKIAKTGIIPTGVDGIITTSVFKEGNNVLNKEHFEYIICGNFQSTDIEQLSNRSRRALSTQINIIKSKNRETSELWFNPKMYAYYLERDTRNEINDLNTPTMCDAAIIRKEERIYKNIKSLPFFRDEDGVYKLDKAEFNNYVFQKQAVMENKNDKLMIRNLKKYGIIFDAYKIDEAPQTSIEKLHGKAQRNEKKATQLAEYKNEIKELKGIDNLQLHCNEGLKYSSHLTVTQKKVFKRVIELSKYTNDNEFILSNLVDVKDGKETILSQAKFTLLKNRITVLMLKNNQIYMDENRKLGIFMKSMYSTFADGEQLPIDEVKSKIEKCLKVLKNDFSFYTEKAKSIKYLKIARLFFDIQCKRQRDKKGKMIVIYQFCNIKNGFFSITNSVFGVTTNMHTKSSEKQIQKTLSEIIADDKNYKAGSILPF